MQMIELFTGCGGMAKGMELAGFSHKAFVEINHFACESLRENFPPEIVYETDVRSFDFANIGTVDAIAGGPPCQPFSLGGLAKAHNDHRDMFPQAIRALSELSPKGFVFENVKGLLRKSFSDYFSYIILRLTYPNYRAKPEEDWRSHLERLRKLIFQKYTGLKYRVQYRLLNAADYGVPQIRERVFIVGVRSDIPTVWSWPQPLCKKHGWKTITEALAGIPHPDNPKHRIPDHGHIKGARQYPGHTGSAVDRPSKTIKAGAHGVPGGENMLLFPDGTVRYMTVHEAKTIQTFPADYKIVGPWGEAMRQIGNAVPVKLAEIIGRKMKQLLSAVPSDDVPFNVDSTGNLLIIEESRHKPSGNKRRAKPSLVGAAQIIE